MALGRLEADGWRTRHDMVDLTLVTPGADPAQRAAPRMLGNTELLNAGSYGSVSDSDIEVDGAP